VTTYEDLEPMGEEDLLAYVLRRVRGEAADPPLAPHRLETPDDFIAAAHEEGAPAFRSRLERVIVRALEAAAVAKYLTAGPDAEAVQNLAELARSRQIKAALPHLLCVAERGAFGGHEGTVEAQTERVALFALACLQEREELWPRWEALWRTSARELWPTVITGMKLCDPYRATKRLPEIVRRLLRSGGVPIGELLWSFGKDPNVDERQIRKELEVLTSDELRFCRTGLRDILATEEEIAAWIPEAPSRAQPGWGALRKHVPREPPRRHVGQLPQKGIAA